MKFAAILALMSACLLTTACAGSGRGGVAPVDPLPASLRQPCQRPEAFLGAKDWEVIAGRLGDELIACGRKHGAAVSYADALVEATKQEK